MNRKITAALMFAAPLAYAGLAIAHGGDEDTPGRLVLFLGQIHPMVVHFPIALLLTALFGEAVFVFTGRGMFGDAARFMIVMAALGALGAMTLGFFAEGAREFYDEYAELVEIHEAFGISVTALSVAAAIFSELARRRDDKRLLWAYRIALLIAAILVGVTGYLGGELVHGIGHLKL